VFEDEAWWLAIIAFASMAEAAAAALVTAWLEKRHHAREVKFEEDAEEREEKRERDREERKERWEREREDRRERWDREREEREALREQGPDLIKTLTDLRDEVDNLKQIVIGVYKEEEQE
jgi:hypothetical protein